MAVEVAAGYVSIYASLTHSEVANTVKNAMSGITGAFAVQADTSAALNSLDTLSSVTNSWGNSLTKIGTVITAAATAFGGFAVSTASQAETTQIALGALSGSAENAKGMMTDLYEFAVKTPFTFTSVSTAAEKLMALGVTADKVKPTLTAVGDAVAAVGGNDASIQNVTHDLGQMMATGKVTSRIMMNLANNNMSSWKWLTEYLNKDATPAIKEMAQQGGDAWNNMLSETREKVKKGEIDAQTGFDAMLWGMENDYGGMMEKESHTVAFIMSNLGDAIKVPLTALKDMSGYKNLADALQNLITPLQNFMTAMNPIINNVLVFAAKGVSNLTEKLTGFVKNLELSNHTTKLVLDNQAGVMSLVRALGGIVVLGPGLKAFSKYSKGLHDFVNMASSPLVSASKKGGDALKTFSSIVSNGKFIETDKLSSGFRGVLESFGNFGMQAKGQFGLAFNVISNGIKQKLTGPDSIFSAFSMLGGTLSDSIKNSVSSAIPGIKTTFNSIWQQFGISGSSLPGKIGSTIKSAFSGIGQVISPIIGGPLQTLASQLGSVATNSGNLSKYVNVMNSLFGKFTVGAFGIGTALVAIGGAAAIAAGAFTMMGGDVGSLVGTMTNDVNNLSDMAVGLINSFGDTLPGLNDAITSSVPGLITAVINAMQSIGSAIMAHSGDFLTLVVNIASQVGSFLAQAAPILLQGALVLFSGLITALAQTINTLVASDQLVTMVQQIGAVLAANLPTLLEAGVQLFSALVMAFIQILPQVIQQIPVLIGAICADFPNWGPPLGDAALTLFNAIVQALPEIVSALLDSLASVIGMVVSNLPGFAGWVLGAAVGLFINIATAVGSIVGDVLGAIGDLLGDAANAISNFDLAEAGRNFIQGFVNGIGDGTQWVISKVQSMCTDALGALKSFFGIASPSRVMAKMGGYLMQGFSRGIDRSAYQAVNSVLAASEKISGSFSPSLDVPDISKIYALGSASFQGISGNANGTTINQSFDTKVVRSDDDLYVAAPIIYRNAMHEAGLVSV